jgi:nucleoprotein TPR
LLLKNNTDIGSYKLEITTLKEKLVSTENKQETILDDLKGKIADQELQLKNLETSQANASKEALEAKKESLAAINKADVATKKSSVLERQLKIAKKKLGETDGDNEQDVESELRAKLESLTTDLEDSKKETETWKARSATYEKLAKDNEAAVSAMTKASDATKKSLEESITKLKEEMKFTDTEMSKRKEVITELTNDLSAQRDERDKAVNKVKQQIARFKADAEKYQNKAEDVESRFVQLQSDVNVLQSDLAEAQSNYERELALHAAVRTDLRTAREESEKAGRLRNTAMEEAATLQSKFKIQQTSLEAEESKREEAEKNFEKKIGASRAENTLLHAQLEKINEQIEKMQSRNAGDSIEADGKSEDVSGDEEMMRLRMDVSELRELVKFVRAEKDAIQGQLDAARRSTERERTKASVARRAVEETQAELKALKESFENTSKDLSEGGTSMADKLKATEEQSRLLGDSNAHLQQQVQELQSNLVVARNELEVSNNALQPAADIHKELAADKAALLAEKESLLREINDWKGRVQSLVSRFNQVDPEVHSKVVKKAEELENQVKALEDKKSSAEEETKRIRTLASRASSQLSKNKQMVENQKTAIVKLTAEKAALVKSQKESSSKKDFDELKEKILRLEEERAIEAIELKGSTERNDKLRDMMRQFQKTMVDLKKEKEVLTKQLTEARSITEQKEAEAAKAVATLKEKESALANSAAAAATAAPIEPATKDIPTKEKPAAAVPKQPVVTATLSADTKTAIEKKEEKQVMPKVPPGGFKFAPSKIVPFGGIKLSPSKTPASISTGSIIAKKKNDAEQEKKVLANTSKNRPVTEFGKQEAPGRKKPTAETNSSEEKGDGEPKTDKQSAPSLKRPVPPNRRNSGEVKEMGLKDKLMEKKRKLMELKAAKAKAIEAKKEDSNIPEPVSAEPDAKRNKTDNSVEGKATETATPKPQFKNAPPRVPNVASAFIKEAAAKMAAKSASRKADSTSEDGELNESEEKPLMGQTPMIGIAGSSAGSIFGGGTKTPTAFGSGFGSGSTSTFGKPSGFGSVGTGFGSSGAASGKSTFAFGGTKPEGGSASASTPSVSAFGGAAFLNIKPPGSSSGTAPQFSFGNSGSSITLPTPGAATTNPNLSMFNAFSSPAASSQPFGGQVSAKPLFGSTQEKVDKEEEEEDGEMPETSN